jgi:ribosomal protein S18 acetylase RimI-like enzyme
MITIRQSTPADLPCVVDHYGPPCTPWDPFGNLKALYTIPLQGLLIAEVDGEYAGFLYWFTGENPWFDPGTTHFAYITELHVLEKYQGQKVGNQLLSYALTQLKKIHVPVFISTSETNIIANHLYEKAGFKPFSRSIHYKLEIDNTDQSP